MPAIPEVFQRLRQEASKVIVGQDEVFELVVVGLFAGGHVLLEGVPGTAKTLMAKTLAYLIRADFKRVQFTPDLMPSDIIGTSVFDLASSKFYLKRGPVFTNILLGDEINRSPAKTQAALLEAMEERQVTIEGERYIMPDLFMVLATQNPVEYEGTYPLPEAQLDRFLFKLIVDYPPQDVENEILLRYHRGFDARHFDLSGLEPVLTPEVFAQVRAQLVQVRVDQAIIAYITAIARETRRSSDLILGGSPRASIALLLGAKTYAALQGRDFVTPDDIKYLVFPVYRHRIILKPETEIEGFNADGVMKKVLAAVEVPR